MAYMSQEKKAKIAPLVKSICKRYGIKATLAVRNHSTLVLNIKSGKIDFIGDYGSTPEARESAKTFGVQVNPYHYKRHFGGEALKFLSTVIPAMNIGNHNNSDVMTDYFDVGWYVDVNIGDWDKPYVVA